MIHRFYFGREILEKGNDSLWIDVCRSVNIRVNVKNNETKNSFLPQIKQIVSCKVKSTVFVTSMVHFLNVKWKMRILKRCLEPRKGHQQRAIWGFKQPRMRHETQWSQKTGGNLASNCFVIKAVITATQRFLKCLIWRVHRTIPECPRYALMLSFIKWNNVNMPELQRSIAI